MSIITIGQEQSVNKAYYLKRMITCPGHYLIPPTVDVYLYEPVALLKNCSDWVEWKGTKYNLKKKRIVRDRFGNKAIDWKKLYELRSKGILLHPKVSAAWAREHVYDPIGFLCQHCDKRCMEGLGNFVERTVKRLNQ